MESLRNFYNENEQGQQSRVTVEVDKSNPAEPGLKLRQESWAEGLGWFTQKTIAVSLEEAPALLNDLQRTINNAKLARSQHRPNTEAKILQFPGKRTKKSDDHSAKPVDNSTAKVLPLNQYRKVR